MMTHAVRRAFPRNRFGRSSFAAAAALVCAASLACSFSYSSGSLSDSSTSSSGSSDSSGSNTAQFRNVATQYTEAYVEAGGKREESFFSGLGDLARKHGVSDWESDPATWEAIGRGVGPTDVSDAQRTAYEAAWSGGDAEKQSAMARLPFDRGRGLRDGLDGALWSVPELFFANIRKGTSEYVLPELRPPPG